MDLYRALRPLLFRLEPELSHRLALNALRAWSRTSTLYRAHRPELPTDVMGIRFPNPVGVAAGLDKNGEHIDALASLGFGFIEIGTVTPRPQPGNPKPRIFRLAQARALVNRLGFNNKGCPYLVERVQRSSYRGVLGINIGKNFDTPLDQACRDYLYCFERVHPIADYVVVNVSSPNTPGLRNLQDDAYLLSILDRLVAARAESAMDAGRDTPILVKVSPDLSDSNIHSIARAIRKSGVEGIVATNTTSRRDEDIAALPGGCEEGGLSGAPLHARTESAIRKFRASLRPGHAIIGVGGVMDAGGAGRLLDAGADLVQMYTGLIYRGPGLVRETLLALERDRRIRMGDRMP